MSDKEPLPERPRSLDLNLHRWDWQHAFAWRMDLKTFDVYEECLCGARRQVWKIDDRG